MNLRSALALLVLALAVTAAMAVPARAQPQRARVEMELASDQAAPPTAAQQWFQLLTDLQVGGLRVRPAQPNDKPAIVAAGTPDARVYRVVGMLDRSGDVVVPGARLRTSNRAAVAEWLTKLRQQGPEGARGERVPFGLSKEQLVQVRKELTQPINFSTEKLRPQEFVDQLADALPYAIVSDATSARQLAVAAAIDVELRGLSAGTALAYVLSHVDLALVPQLDANHRPALAIVLLRPKQERWPVGWPSTKPRRELVPALFDNVDVEINDVELPRVLAAVAEHLGVPVLLDEQALAADKIDLAQVKVSLPAKRSAYELVLRKVLVPKALAHEVRLDEADRPFVWITTARRQAQSAKAKTKESAP